MYNSNPTQPSFNQKKDCCKTEGSPFDKVGVVFSMIRLTPTVGRWTSMRWNPLILFLQVYFAKKSHQLNKGLKAWRRSGFLKANDWYFVDVNRQLYILVRLLSNTFYLYWNTNTNTGPKKYWNTNTNTFSKKYWVFNTILFPILLL